MDSEFIEASETKEDKKLPGISIFWSLVGEVVSQI